MSQHHRQVRLRAAENRRQRRSSIFALFHGKIVPLGKLPDTSFKKSRTEVANGKETAEEHRSPSHSESITVKSSFGLPPNLESKNQQQKAELETRMIKRPATKDVTATAKDEVPDILPDLKNPEFIKHVKGIVLDDGKMVPLSEHHKVEESEKNEDATTKSSEATEPAETKDNEKSYAMTTTHDRRLCGRRPEKDQRLPRCAPFTSLVWSDDLATEAQKMAEHLADMKSLEISSDLDKRGYGENVAKVWANFKTAGDAATTMWYKQSSNYRYEDPRLDQNTGQFAQVVWKTRKSWAWAWLKVSMI
eukprot:gene5184-5838_t